MKQKIGLLLLSFFLYSSTTIANSCSNSVATYIGGRSLSVNLPRMIAGTIGRNAPDTSSFSGHLSIVPGYSRTFDEKEIVDCLFGTAINQCGSCPEIKIKGSAIEDRDDSASWLADYFGLATDYDGSITFGPKISNFFIDLSYYINLDQWVEGLWFHVWAPFVHTKWDLNFTELCRPTFNDHASGYFNDNIVLNSDLLSRATDFFQKRQTPTIKNTDPGNTPIVSFESLQSCRWGKPNCDTHIAKNGIADIRMALGWNFMRETYHVGFGIIGAAPTGTRPSGCYLFEPVIGNGHHGELGATISAGKALWESEDGVRNFYAQVDANITHLFTTKQTRCFDLCNKPMSRYMLAEKLSSPASDLFGVTGTDPSVLADGVAPSSKFANAYAPVANLTCSNVDVSIGVQADIIAALSFRKSNASVDFGYNLWVRSCEKIEFDCDCPPRLAVEKDTWALKGDAQVYGFTGANESKALSGTQSDATIHQGTNAAYHDNPPNDVRNFGVDNARFAQAQSDADPLTYNASGDATLDRIKTSVDPLFINFSDINLQGARTRGLTHSLFLHGQYRWDEYESTYRPYMGFGAQFEFASNGNTKDSECQLNCDTTCNNSPEPSELCNSCCDSCSRCALSQWAVWFKGGISFN